MKLSTAELFVFDFDGTLAPNLDLPEMRRRVIALTRAHGVPAAHFEHLYMVEIITAAGAWLASTESSPASVQHAERAEAYQSQAHQLIEDFELDAAAGMEVFPKTREVLGGLKQADKRTSIVTRNCEQAVRKVFPDVDDYCDLLLARDNVEFLKPDPRHLQCTLTHLERTPQRSVMIGDGRMDMQVGRTLGLTCVGVLSGSSDAPALTAAGAHLIVENIAGLTAHL